jgi:capsid protein
VSSTLDKPNLAKAYSELRSDFRASKQGRFTPRLKGVNPLGSGADYHYRSEREFLHLIERARDYERNDMIVGSGISRLTSNILQDGFKPDPQTGSDDLDSRLKDLWTEWSEEPDYCHSEGEFDWYQIERLAFRSIVRDGDCFMLPHRSGHLQPVEAHRPRTPSNTTRNVVHGILLDGRARRKQVWFSKEDLGLRQTLSRVSDTKQYDVRDAEGNRQIFHLYFPKRFSQRRGITALAPTSDTIGQHDDLQFSTLVKAQLASLVVLLEEQEKGSHAGVSGPGIKPPTSDQPTTTVDSIASIGAGLHFKTAPGNKMSGFTPNIPNPEFFPHATLLLTFIAVNLDMPVQMLLLDPTKTNFSGWRGAIDQARIRFREMQLDLISKLHKPTYHWKVRQWLELDELAKQFAAQPGVSPFKHTWKRPSWPYIEPLKDSQADDLQQTRFLNSPRRIQGARGRDWDEVAPEIVADKSKLIRLAIEEADSINTDHPSAGVSWREILGPGLTSQNVAPTQEVVSNDDV